MLPKTLFAAALILLPAAAEARDWHYLTLQPGRGVVFLDTDSIQREPNMFPIGRTLFVLRDGESGETAAIEMVLAVDCVQHKQRILEVTTYAADGRVLATSGSSARWDLTASQLMADIEFAICGRRVSIGERSYGGGLPIAEGRAYLLNASP